LQFARKWRFAKSELLKTAETQEETRTKKGLAKLQGPIVALANYRID
jgi:hypothetical protein